MICNLNILYYHPVSEATPNSKITGAYCVYKGAIEGTVNSMEHKTRVFC
jgi:hypothetical protein